MSAFTLLGLPAEIYTQVIDSVLEYFEGEIKNADF